MSVQEIADQADMIVAGYAFKVLEDHIEITDLNNLSKTAVIQNDELVESVVSDEEDAIVMKYYNRNKDLLKGDCKCLNISPLKFVVIIYISQLTVHS